MFGISIPGSGNLFSHIKGGRASLGVLICGQLALPVAAAASVSTALGEVQGDLAVSVISAITNVHSGYPSPTNLVWELGADQVKADQDAWTYDANLNQQFSYGGGYQFGGNYSAFGKLALTQVPTLVPAAGLTAGDVTVTITGRYQTTGSGGFWLNPSAGYLKSDGYFSGVGDFTYSTTLGELAMNSQASTDVLNWTALFPYVQTQAGGAQTSTVSIQLTTLTLSQSVSAVPEPASAWLGALGVCAVSLAIRRSRRLRVSAFESDVTKGI